MTESESKDLGERMERIENRLDAVERRLDAIDDVATQVRAIHQAIVGSLDKPGGIERRIERAEVHIDALSKRLATVAQQTEINTDWIHGKKAQLALLYIIVSLIGAAELIRLFIELGG